MGRPRFTDDIDVLSNDELELRRLCNQFADTKTNATLVYNGLQRYAKFNYGAQEIFKIDDLRSLSLEDISKIRNIGVSGIQIVAKMKENLEQDLL